MLTEDIPNSNRDAQHTLLRTRKQHFSPADHIQLLPQHTDFPHRRLQFKSRIAKMHFAFYMCQQWARETLYSLSTQITLARAVKGCVASLELGDNHRKYDTIVCFISVGRWTALANNLQKHWINDKNGPRSCSWRNDWWWVAHEGDSVYNGIVA